MCPAETWIRKNWKQHVEVNQTKLYALFIIVLISFFFKNYLLKTSVKKLINGLTNGLGNKLLYLCLMLQLLDPARATNLPLQRVITSQPVHASQSSLASSLVVSSSSIGNIKSKKN